MLKKRTCMFIFSDQDALKANVSISRDMRVDSLARGSDKGVFNVVVASPTLPSKPIQRYGTDILLQLKPIKLSVVPLATAACFSGIQISTPTPHVCL